MLERNRVVGLGIFSVWEGIEKRLVIKNVVFPEIRNLLIFIYVERTHLLENLKEIIISMIIGQALVVDNI